MHGLDVPYPHIPKERNDMVVQVCQERGVAVGPEFRLLIGAGPGQGIGLEHHVVSNVHACTGLQLCLRYFLVQLRFALRADIHSPSGWQGDMGCKLLFCIRH